LARVPTLRPDVAVLDVRLPDGDGVSVCRELRSSMASPPACLMLTSRSDDEALVGALVAGAAGYLVKQIGGLDLGGAIRAAAKGRSVLHPTAAPAVLERMHGCWAREDPRLMSPQEQQILALIADGLTNRQIGDEMHLSEESVKNHVFLLLHKLGVTRPIDAAVYAT